MRQVRDGRGAHVLVGIVLVAGLALWCAACAPPTPPPSLSLDLADGAADVPLDSPLAVTASGAVLDSVTIERLDAPGAAPQFTLSDHAARLAGTLAPDARYRLTARAAASSTAGRAPWQEPERIELVQERTFSTVASPRLVGQAEPVVFEKGQPLEFRFSQPLARAEASAPAPVQARATVDRGDPRLLRVELDGVAPGQDFALQLSGIAGRNGAPATDRTLAVHAPAPAELLTVSGAPPDDRVAVPLASAVALEWNAPVRSLLYSVAGETETWSGPPTQRVELPLALSQGQSRTLLIEDARTADGGWLPEPRTIELFAPPPLKLAAVWPAQGAVGVSPEADPTFRFSEPVADRAAAEAAIHFDPPVPGRFAWLSPERVHFVPADGFPSQTEVSITIDGGPGAVTGTSGSYLAESLSLSFQTGKKKVIDVALGSQRMTLLEDGQPVWTAPVATGVRGAETPTGTYQVQYKMPVARFRGVNPNGSRYDIPDVRWVMAFFEDYTIHGAYWRHNFGTPGSAGCISLTDANAKYVYDWAPEGTIVRVHR